MKCLSLPTAHAANLISDGKVACTGHPWNKVKEDAGDGYATCNSRRVAASSSSPNRQRPKCSSKLIIKTGEHFPQSTGVYVFTLVFFTCWGKKKSRPSRVQPILRRLDVSALRCKGIAPCSTLCRLVRQI